MLKNKHISSELISPQWLQIYFAKSFLWIKSKLSSENEESLMLQRCVEKSLCAEEMQDADDLVRTSLWPMLLRKNKAPNVLLEIAFYESLLIFLKQNYLDQVFKFSLPIIIHEKANFCLNPSLQFCALTEASVLLQRSAGLYLLYVCKDEFGKSVLREYFLSREKAVFIEWLQELVIDGQQVIWQQLTEAQKKLLNELVAMQVVSLHHSDE